MWKTPGECVVIEPDAREPQGEDSASSRAPEGTLVPKRRTTDRYWSICLFRHLVDCNYWRVVQRLGWSLECRFSSGSHPFGNKSTTSYLVLTIQKFSVKTLHLAPAIQLQWAGPWVDSIGYYPTLAILCLRSNIGQVEIQCLAIQQLWWEESIVQLCFVPPPTSLIRDVKHSPLGMHWMQSESWSIQFKSVLNCKLLLGCNYLTVCHWFF